MVDLQFMQISIFSPRTLVFHHFGLAESVCWIQAPFFVSFDRSTGEKTVMLFTVKWLCIIAQYP